MNQEQQAQLLAYIQQQLQRGQSDDTIRATLKQYNWSDEAIADVLSRAKNGVQNEMPQPTVAEAKPTDVDADTIQVADSATASVDTTAVDSANSTPAVDAMPAQQVAGRYGVFAAINDFIEVARKNGRVLLVTTLVGYGVAAVLLAVASILIIASVFLGAGTAQYGHALFDFVFRAIFVGALINLVAIFLSVISFAFITAVNSSVLMAGANGQQRTVAGALAIGLKAFPRVFLATIILGLTLFGPLFIFWLVMMITAMAGVMLSGLIIILWLLGVAAIVWSFIASLRFSLIPLVALFEPKVPFLRLPARSFELVRGSGQWFIFKTLLLFFVGLILLSIIVELLLGEIILAQLVGGLFLVVLSVVWNGVLVMLYRRQRSLIG